MPKNKKKKLKLLEKKLKKKKDKLLLPGSLKKKKEKLLLPEQDTGLDFEKEYETAKAMASLNPNR